MKRKHTTQPDHPVHPVNADDPDLTKREYFAAMALQGMLAQGGKAEIGENNPPNNILPVAAVFMADELINALNYTDDLK